MGAETVIAPAGTLPPLLPPLLLFPPLLLVPPLPLGTTVVAVAASFLYSSRDLDASAVLKKIIVRSPKF